MVNIMGNSAKKEARPSSAPPSSTSFLKPENNNNHPNSESGKKKYRHKNIMGSERKSVKLGNGSVNVSIIKGDLTTEKADVVVCTANKNLDLSRGRASKVLMEAAGDDMQQDCKSKYEDGIEHDEIAMVSAGNLPCKKVYFVALPVWGSGHSEKKVLSKIITKCLEEADRHKSRSIALPALGTGFLKYPTDDVAHTTLQCVEDFSNQHAQTSLETVSVIVYYKDTSSYQAFENEARSRATERNSPGASGHGAKPKRIGGLGNFGLKSIMAGRNMVSDNSIGEIKIHVTSGKLAEFQADALVNNTRNDLKLDNGGMSEALLEAAGPGLQDECNDMYPDGISAGEVAPTGGYSLQCKKVYHGSLPKWDKEYTSKKILSKFVTACLREAEEDNFSSIAFPALGTGSLNFPANVSAATMFKCIIKHEGTNQHTSLTDISIVIYDGGKDWKKIKSIYEDELANVLKESDDEEEKEARNYHFKMLENALGNAMHRGNPGGNAQKGSKDWFKNLYKTVSRSPNYWTVFHSNKSLKDWHMDSDDIRPCKVRVDKPTFDAVNKIVQDTWLDKFVGQGRDAKGLSDLNYTKIKVKHVERIENSETFEKYAQRRQELFRKAAKRGAPKLLEKVVNSSGPILTTQAMPSGTTLTADIYPEINEHYMFHGTTDAVVDVIVKQGLDCRLAGTNAMFGQGVYGAESSTKADQYADPRGNRTSNDKKMFLMRMCLGDAFVQSKAENFVRSPCMHCSKGKCTCEDNSFYDSVVGDGGWNFREFVVYDRTQVYPEYVITYVRE